jgi:hypothetical protein
MALALGTDPDALRHEAAPYRLAAELPPTESGPAPGALVGSPGVEARHDR